MLGGCEMLGGCVRCWVGVRWMCETLGRCVLCVSVLCVSCWVDVRC